MISLYTLIVLVSFACSINGAPPLVTVNTTRGVVIGTFMNLGTNISAQYYGQADVFSGIPFAHPPTRFSVTCKKWHELKCYIFIRNHNDLPLFHKILTTPRIPDRFVYKGTM